jgi:hypothetical protein
MVEDPFSRHAMELPPPAMIEGEEEYEVKRIKNSRRFRRQLQYFVQWKDYDERSWKPAANLDGL